jgi:hypothetical protein
VGRAGSAQISRKALQDIQIVDRGRHAADELQRTVARLHLRRVRRLGQGTGTPRRRAEQLLTTGSAISTPHGQAAPKPLSAVEVKVYSQLRK